LPRGAWHFSNIKSLELLDFQLCAAMQHHITQSPLHHFKARLAGGRTRLPAKKKARRTGTGLGMIMPGSAAAGREFNKRRSASPLREAP
jgi:hypothetical protein